MPISSINLSPIGLSGVSPNLIFIDTNDTLAEIAVTGYLNSWMHQNIPLSESDMVLVTTKTSPSATSTQTSWAGVSYSGGNWSLLPYVGPGSVMVPTIANHIATYTNTTGTLSEDAATAINAGNIQAGLSGTAGFLSSYPATSAKGSLHLTAVANTGDTITTISNVAMAQPCVISIPDPGNAIGRFLISATATPFTTGHFAVASGTTGLMIDSGAKILSGTTSAYGGGGTSNAFTVAGLSSGAVGSAVIRTSTSAVSIAKAVPGTNTLTITFSADPGANTTVDYVYTTAGLT